MLKLFRETDWTNQTGPLKLVQADPVLNGTLVQSGPGISRTEVVGPVQKMINGLVNRAVNTPRNWE